MMESSVEDNVVTIKVCDDRRNIEKDFKCKRVLLLQHMKYFNQYLEPSSSSSSSEKTNNTLCITVHCDLRIFEWLVRYIHDTSDPALTCENVLSILISADFLQMQVLHKACIDFVIKSLDSIIKLKIDFTLLSPSVFKEIATACTIQQLASISSPTNTHNIFVKNIFKARLACDTAFFNSSLAVCIECEQVFLKSAHKVLECSTSKSVIQADGIMHSRHIIGKDFDVKTGITGGSSCEKFWFLWSRSLVVRCEDCHQVMTLNNVLVDGCYYHESPTPEWSDTNAFEFTCCNQPAFDLKKTSSGGCTSKSHSGRTDCIYPDNIPDNNNVKAVVKDIETKCDFTSLLSLGNQEHSVLLVENDRIRMASIMNL